METWRTSSVVLILVGGAINVTPLESASATQDVGEIEAHWPLPITAAERSSGACSLPPAGTQDDLDGCVSEAARDVLRAAPVASAVGSAVSQLRSLFPGQGVRVDLVFDPETGDEGGRLVVEVQAQQDSATVNDLLAKFDDWWLEQAAFGEFDVWVRHV
jgi:hypothetical protein